MNVAIIGASIKEDRYSYKAQKKLSEHGHRVFPVHPSLDEAQGVSVYHSLADIPSEVDTVTVYVNSMRLLGYKDEIVNLRPKRVIFNPGTENEEVIEACKEVGIEAIEGCTLVMLQTGQF